MRNKARLPLEALLPCLLEVPGRPERQPSAAAPGQVAERMPVWRGTKPLHWKEVFGNDGPVEMEVGFGKGLFLQQASGERPGTNFVGIEIERRYCLLTATRLVRAGRSNVRLVCADARWFLHEWIANESVDALHIYFPDPWWKQRHRKRRLFTAQFAQEAARVLKKDGKLHFATDVAEYFEETAALVNGLSAVAELPRPAETAPRHDLDYLTHFERKYRKQDKPIYRTLWHKKMTG